jgi:hypothetical protein
MPVTDVRQPEARNIHRDEFIAGIPRHPAQSFQRKPQLVDSGAGRYVHCRDGVFTHQPIAFQAIQILECFDG